MLKNSPLEEFQPGKKGFLTKKIQTMVDVKYSKFCAKKSPLACKKKNNSDEGLSESNPASR